MNQEEGNVLPANWQAAINAQSTRLAALPDAVHECSKLMRSVIRGAVQIGYHGRFDVASSPVWSHLYNGITWVLRFEGRGKCRPYPNAIAASGEMGRLFIDENPAARGVLEDICLWWLRLSASDDLDPAIPGRKAIWRPDGYLIIRYITPTLEAWQEAEKM